MGDYLNCLMMKGYLEQLPKEKHNVIEMVLVGIVYKPLEKPNERRIDLYV